MIVEIIRDLSGTYYASNTTITFSQNPYLLPNNDLTLYFTDNDARFSTKVTSVSGNNAVVGFSDNQYSGKNLIAKTPNYGAGMTGTQTPFSFKLTTPPNAIIQASSTGGTSSINLEASTDNVHWVTLATLPITEANSNTSYTTVTSPWAYGRLNIASIATGQSISVNKAI